ncbi:MAG TPA: hypothetical protein VF756_02425 [Thermoanaerobaculia bacterium]
MKKLVSGVALLLLCLGASAPLQAADCLLATPAAPATSALTAPLPNISLPDQEPAQKADLAALDSTFELRPPPNDCGFLACEQTPTGCACEGFYCGDIFICGIPWW